MAVCWRTKWMPKLGRCAGRDVRELSEQACQQLLEVEVAHLPSNAEQLQTLLESGMVPVTQVGSCLSVCPGVGLAGQPFTATGLSGTACVCTASGWISQICITGHLSAPRRRSLTDPHSGTRANCATLWLTHC